MTTTTCLIVEDELRAQEKLLAILQEDDLFENVAVAPSLSEARARITSEPPDVLFLDIRLPDGDGLSLLDIPDFRPIVVFATALTQHAVSAFELQALDYLVKPFSASRVAQTLDRVRLALASSNPLIGRSTGTIHRESRPQQIVVRVADGLRSLPVAAIERIEGVDDHAGLWYAGRRYLLYRRLGELEQLLSTVGFVRVHRSHLVQLSFVDRLVTAQDGRVELVMHSGARVPCSKTRVSVVRTLFESR